MPSPDEHYAEAERLLDSVAAERDGALPYVAFRLARAQVHALLAQCPPEYGDDHYDHYIERSAPLITTPATKEEYL